MDRYYFYDDKKLIVYHTELDFHEVPSTKSLIYIGTSDNPKPKMAAAAFMKTAKINTGYKLRELK